MFADTNTVKPVLKTTLKYKEHTPQIPQGYIFIVHVIEPVYKDHLCIRTTFCWTLWGIPTGHDVHVLS